MRVVQFRVHPGIGCPRIGNSALARHLASEFPFFSPGAVPNLRFRPRVRLHPKTYFTSDADSVAATKAAWTRLYNAAHLNGLTDDIFKGWRDLAGYTLAFTVTRPSAFGQAGIGRRSPWPTTRVDSSRCIHAERVAGTSRR